MVITKKSILTDKHWLFLCKWSKIEIKMSFQKYKTNSYCVGQKHYTGKKNIVGEITLNKKNW